MMKLSFGTHGKSDFYTQLKHRVDKYFETSGQPKQANFEMWVKTALLFTLYFISYGAVISDRYSGVALIGWYASIGALMGLFGFNLSHDIMHGAFFSSPKLNKLGSYFFDLNGSSSFVWKITHNGFHHTYTNIPGFDQDIDKAILLRLSPKDRLYPFHAFQQFYAPFLYLFTSLNWMFYSDFIYFFKSVRQGQANRKDKILFFTFKFLYISLFLLIPLAILSAPSWQVILGFISLHFAGSLIIAIVFQLAHVVEGVDFPLCNQSGVIDDTWVLHQLKTTSNFATHSKVWGHLVGGLNYQIEHHLFTHICHVHYPAISKILKQATLEYGFPYLEKPSFSAAVASHFRTLKHFGKPL